MRFALCLCRTLVGFLEEGSTYLSMIVITGATIQAAENPAVASAASLNPKFLVFHTRGSVNGSARAGARVTVFEDTSILDVEIPTPGTLGAILRSLD